jgi:AMMECR1 domain-containing protein
MNLSAHEKCILIRLARKHVSGFLDPGNQEETPVSTIPESLNVRCGVFVSLYVKDKLRGCIGTFSENDPLHSSVQKMALSAATTDGRFAPLDRDELKDLKIEITLGKHGIYIQRGSNRGTLLPQVAVSQKWNVEQFLGNCAKHKAGLGWDGWRDAELYTYEAIVFNSEEIGPDC